MSFSKIFYIILPPELPNLMRQKFTLLLFIVLFISRNSQAQPLYKVNLDEKVQRSSLILEGKVIDQKSFWNAQHTMIFTSNIVEIYKIFKGAVSENTVEVMTQGGSVEGDYIGTSDLLKLKTGETGIFFVSPNSISLKSPVTNKPLFDVYSSDQGFFHYDLKKLSASAPFIYYKNIERELYPELTRKTNQPYKVINSKFSLNASGTNKVMSGPIVSSFSPSTVNAGALNDPTNNLLTINGSGFGSSPSGSAGVYFEDADDSDGKSYFGVPYNDPVIVSWTDTKIQLRVPTTAGTGYIIVSDASGNTANSAGKLTVFYSILDATFTIGGTNYTKESKLMNTNGSGGYTILYSTNSAGTGVDITADPAQATFKRALTTWKEIAGYNVIEGGNTSVQAVANDGQNVIMFDNQNTTVPALSAGVLGVCYYFASMCGNATYSAQRTGFDIVIRNAAYSQGSATFTDGPCPPLATDFNDIDLETVLLHELGHSLGLGHINKDYQGNTYGQVNPGALMNWAVLNSVRRNTPDYASYSGAVYQLTPQGNTYGSCGLSTTEMTTLVKTTESKDNCPVSFPSTALSSGTVVNFDLVHATSNLLSDPSYTQVTTDGTGTPLTNNAFYALKTGTSGGSLNITVSNYSTTPAALASCTQIYGGIPVTGIQLSLYQVGSCPSGQSFPTPLFYTIFSGNGSLPSITGLAANTNYLIYVGGVQNTKANFSLSMSGTVVLPIKLTDFHGQIFNEFNQVYWTADQLVNVTRMIIQKSNDGISFQDIGSVNTLNEIMDGSFKDLSPFVKSYYRLAIVNQDGHIDYSKIITLERSNKDLLTVFPNPASNSIQVQLNSPDNNLYKINLYNSVGQLVKTALLLPGNQFLSVSTNDLAKGIYQLCIYKDGAKIQDRKVVLQ